MEYDPKKIKKLEDQAEKETKLMYKYKCNYKDCR